MLGCRCQPLSAFVGRRAAVESGGFAADEPEPVELGGDEGGVGYVAVQGDAERHHVNGDSHLPGVGRVHEGEEENTAEEEGHQDEDPVHLVEERVLHFELGKGRRQTWGEQNPISPWALTVLGAWSRAPSRRGCREHFGGSRKAGWEGMEEEEGRRGEQRARAGGSVVQGGGTDRRGQHQDTARLPVWGCH